MFRNIAFYAPLFYFVTLSGVVFGQENSKNTYSDPAEISVLNPSIIDDAVNKSFSKSSICNMKNGIVSFVCELNAKGNIENIKVSNKFNISIDYNKLNILMLRLKQHVLFYIPTDLKKDKMKHYRKGIIYIPFNAYCT